MLLSLLNFNELDLITNLRVNLRLYFIVGLSKNRNLKINILNIFNFYRNAAPQDRSLQKKDYPPPARPPPYYNPFYP